MVQIRSTWTELELKNYIMPNFPLNFNIPMGSLHDAISEKFSDDLSTDQS